MEATKENIIEALRRVPHGAKLQELGTLLGLNDKTRHRLRKLVGELAEAGTLERGPGGRFRIPGLAEAGPALFVAAKAPLATLPHAPAPATRTTPHPKPVAGATDTTAVGRIRVHPAGYGFVERDDGEVDVFVPARYRGAALDGDKVRLSTWGGVKGTEGRVEEVLERGRAKLTGTVRAQGRTVFLEPDDPRIASTYGHVDLEEGAGDARVGQCVVAEITRYPEAGAGAGSQLRARVSHVLGDADDPRTEVLKVIACADIPDTFPEDALAAARRVSQTLLPEDFADRLDLRDRPFLTIDPETARDFDDAVCVEPRGNGHRVWVAVADVSHYVRPGTALDREARIRGCSVYLPDRAVPMLPPELSAGICSLNPEVDRCAMVARIDLDAHGDVKETSFCAAVIRSHARLDYPGVAAALAGDFRGPRARYQEWAQTLIDMNALAKKMRAKRRLRGALDFDLPEARVILDEDNPRLVRDVRRSKASEGVKEAYQLVEEYMLAANGAVAGYFQSRGLDAVWRVHAIPDVERLEAFAKVAQGFGIDFDAEKGQKPKAVQQVLTALAGKPFERALHFMALRSLKQATYDTVNVGHFGLAMDDYLHFTSPIRRYPDLIVHRLLKYHLRKDGLPSGGAMHQPPPAKPVLQAMAQESSAHERRASSAEREIVDMYRAYLMRDRVGEELDGIISGVAAFGVFVECNDPFVEGLVRVDALGQDSFEYDESRLRLVGRRNGRAFTIGDPVRVKIESVSVARRRIEMSLLAGGNDVVVEERPATRSRGRSNRPSLGVSHKPPRGGNPPAPKKAGTPKGQKGGRDKGRGGRR